MKQGLNILLLACLLAGCASAPKDVQSHPRDPWEPYNRQVFAFNRTVDRYIWRPLARGYLTVAPKFVEVGVSNFFTNLSYPIDIVNLLLQGKPAASGKALGRFAVNSTLGVLGLVDVASRMDIPKYNEDFGQTLAVWGWEGSPYVVLPILGGASLSQTIGYVPDYYFNVGWREIEDETWQTGLALLNVVSLRALVLPTSKNLRTTYDPYSLYRDTYFQRRQYLIDDGETQLPDYETLLPMGGQDD